MQRSLLFRQNLPCRQPKLLHQNLRQPLLLQLRSHRLPRQIFLLPQNQKNLLLLQKENGKARAAAAGKARAVAGKVSLAASDLKANAPKARAAGKVSPAVAGKARAAALSPVESGPKVMVRAAGKVSLVALNPVANGRDRAAALSPAENGPKVRAVSGLAPRGRARAAVSDHVAKTSRCHRR